MALLLAEVEFVRAWPEQAAIAEICYCARANRRLDERVLLRSWAALLARHESLRCTFVRDGSGTWTKKLLQADEVAARSFAVVRLPDAGADTMDAALERTRRTSQLLMPHPFASATSLLCTMFLCATADSSVQRIVCIFNHAIWDGFSSGVFFQDLATAYNQLESGAAQATFATSTYSTLAFGDALRRYAHSDALLYGPLYWRDYFARYKPFGLPQHEDVRVKPEVQMVWSDLPAGAKPHSLALCVQTVAQAVRELTGQTDGLVSLVFHGRSVPETVKHFFPGNVDDCKNNVGNHPVVYMQHFSADWSVDRTRQELKTFPGAGFFDQMACNAYFDAQMPKPVGATVSVNVIPFGLADGKDSVLSLERIPLTDTHHYSGFRARNLVKTFFFVGNRMNSPMLLVHYDRSLYSADTIAAFRSAITQRIAAAASAAKGKL